MPTPSYYRYWGKARPEGPGDVPFHLLPYHCLDVAAVGFEYLLRAASLRQFLQGRLGDVSDSSLARWICFWLALHDLGKFSEAFQSQRPDLFRQLRAREPDPAKPYSLRHDSLGMLVWKGPISAGVLDKSTFGEDSESFLDGLDFWMRAVTGHHGQPPEEDQHWLRHFHDSEDRRAISEYFSDIRALFLTDTEIAIPSTLGPERFYHVSVELSWWLAGVAVLADWLGSNTDFFQYRAGNGSLVSLREYWDDARRAARRALDASGVVPTTVSYEQGIRELFPRITAPSPLQRWAQTTSLKSGPQIHLLEDVTGAGKTEAAMLLTHRLMANGTSQGFFVGLPTMATANAMYGRIAEVYLRLYAGDASLALAHGQRDLVEAFAATVVRAGPRDHDARQKDQSATARCTAWLADHNKRALVAASGVGTLDQALLAVLHSRHQSLRLLGLFGKVLLVDEVHACDAYMQRVLESLLEFHARGGGSAILLSATLPQRMKRALVEAFARGCRLESPPMVAKAFPLATSWTAGDSEQLKEEFVETRAEVRRTLELRYVSHESKVYEVIEQALRDRKCICWIRNTISDALECAENFAARLPEDRLTLFHARFALRDRLALEERVLARFGLDSGPAERTGQLLIATQVVEQSLDLDFDVLISDLAPVDRLIQRAGRLHRHVRTVDGTRLVESGARDLRGPPCLWVLGPEWTDMPKSNWYKQFFPKAAAVYPNHAELWETARLVQRGVWRMPEEARELVESVFGADSIAPPGLETNAGVAIGQALANTGEAQQNTLKLADGYVRRGIDWWSEAKTPSRLGEAVVNVVLAVWDGDDLRTWVEGPHASAYSSVRVPERLISRAVEPSSPARLAAMARLTESLPGEGKWSVLLPLEWGRSNGVGYAYGSGDAVGTAKTWTYSRELGLRRTPVVSGSPSGAIPTDVGNIVDMKSTGEPGCGSSPS